MANKVVRYFPDCHMGQGHKALSILAKKHNIVVDELPDHEFVIFMNRAHTALKMFASGNVIAHLKMPGNKKINPETIAHLPRHFGGTRINYDAALRRAVAKDLGVEVAE